MRRARITRQQLALLELAATQGLDHALRDWLKLRRLLAHLGAPSSPHLHGPALRDVAAEVLVDLGLRPRPDGPLVCVSPHVFMRTWPRPRGAWESA